MNKVVCVCCKEAYTNPSLIEDFENGVCLPCQVNLSEEKKDAETQRQLDIYNSLAKTAYNITDVNAFYIDCGEGFIKRSDLLTLPNLLEIYDWMLVDQQFVSLEMLHSRESIQLELFDELPF